MEKLEKHSLKIQLATAIGVVGFIIYYTFIFSTQYGQLKASINATGAVANNNVKIITIYIMCFSIILKNKRYKNR